MAFTFTGTPSTSLIDLASGTGTVAEMVTDIGNTAVAESFGNVHVLKGTSGQQIEVSNNVTLTLEAGHSLVWAGWTINGVALEILTGGTFIAEGGSTLTMDSAGNSSANNPAIVSYGDFQCNGSADSVITIRRYGQIAHYPRTSNSNFVMTYVNLDSCQYSNGGFQIQFPGDGGGQSFGCTDTFIMRNITQSYQSGVGINFFYGVPPQSHKIEDCIFEFHNVGYLLGSFRFKRCIFRTANANPGYRWGGTLAHSRGVYQTTPVISQHPYAMQQPKLTFDSCTFDGSLSSGSIYITGNQHQPGVYKFKNCTIENGSYGLIGFYQPLYLRQGTLTFNSVTNEISYNTERPVLDVYELNLTVQDKYGNPISNAGVSVIQNEGKEAWHFRTNDSGNILDCSDDPPVFVYRETANGSTYTYWSDGSTEDKKHTMTISHKDYKPKKYSLIFDQDHTIVATLEDYPTTGPVTRKQYQEDIEALTEL